MPENGKGRCVDTAKACAGRIAQDVEWFKLWELQTSMKQQAKLEQGIACAIDIIATMYFAMKSHAPDALTKIMGDPMVCKDVQTLRCL